MICPPSTLLLKLSKFINRATIYTFGLRKRSLWGDTMEMCRKEELFKECPCTYPCRRRGKCCECIAYHRSRGELPACYFTPEQERTYDRSIEYYVRANHIL